MKSWKGFSFSVFGFWTLDELRTSGAQSYSYNCTVRAESITCSLQQRVVLKHFQRSLFRPEHPFHEWKFFNEMNFFQGLVKVSKRPSTMLRRNLQEHNRILPIKEFIREVMLHDPFMKLGCLDFGTKCIGTAATDETKQFTFPVGMIPVKQPPKTIESLMELHRQLQAFSKEENVRYLHRRHLSSAVYCRESQALLE